MPRTLKPRPLAPCPFCRSPPASSPITEGFTETGWRVGCTRNTAPAHLASVIGRTQQEAEAFWNQRKMKKAA